ncbi:flagellin [Methanospirillum hungatei]|uniref:flagellin n=1 Tax=Methanospirillum hungatei TaxID=2203 RepID=UPI0026F1C336|nr:flagellin [Methanospirillum hungatei]MCA1916272.1 flagellin [Methanospirillum hungatei]
MKKEAAFSGLEAAIVLIAFVVVAAVFSYVMLGAGFFATQKSQEVTYSGIKQSTSNLVLDGQLYGTMSGSPSALTTIKFYLAIPEGGQPQKLSDVSFLLTVNNGAVNDVKSSATFNPSTDVLAAGDRVQVTLASLSGPQAGGSFTLEIKPKVGASTLVAKTLATGYNGGVII